MSKIDEFWSFVEFMKKLDKKAAVGTHNISSDSNIKSW